MLPNENFARSNPAAVKFMEQVSIPIEDVSAQNQKIREGEDSARDIRRHAENWIANHQQQFQQWLAVE
jgi:glycine betaine/proline transport system substrate-binding protein